MAKHYKYVNGKRLIVVNNYELGSDLIPEEVNLIPDITQADQGKALMADENGEPKWTAIPSQLPTLTGNSGKVLKVNSGATGVEWDNESAELPSLTGNAGKVLKVNSGATGTEWANETTELPAVTSADEGDVLTVNASGQWSKATPSSGGGPIILSFTGSSNNWTTENTPEEYTAALTAGVPVFLELNFTTQYAPKYTLMNCVIIDNNMYFTDRVKTGSTSGTASTVVYELYTDGSDIYLYDTTYQWTVS